MQLQPKWTTVELGEAQRADPDLALVIQALENQSRPSQEEISVWSPVARRYLSEWDRLHFVDGALRRRWYDNQGRESHDQHIVSENWWQIFSRLHTIVLCQDISVHVGHS